MKRLTYWNCKAKNSALPVSVNDMGDTVSLEDICAKLAAYEDTGMEPEEVLTGLELANVYAAMLPLKQYQSVGPVEEFRALKEEEQKRQEGCQRCWNGECMMSGVDYNCETTCDKCRYNLRDKKFCPHCGRDLRGDNHENN